MKKLVHTIIGGGPVAALARAATRGRLRILCYHGLWTTPGFAHGDLLFMPPEQFERRMRRMRQSGLPLLTLEEAVRALADRRLPAGAVVVTIDDGWASTYTHMLPVLEAFAIPATLYVTSWYVGRDLPILAKAVEYLFARSGRTGDADATAACIDALPLAARADALKTLSAELNVPLDWWETRQFHLMRESEVTDAAARGLDLQLHTHRHGPVLTSTDLEENRAALMRWTGRPADAFAHYCYPSGIRGAGDDAILRTAGIRSATTCERGTNPAGSDAYGLRRFLDGRSVTDAEFDAYLAGGLDMLDAGLRALRSSQARS